MFIGMNHFDVDPARGGEFEERWRERDSHLDEVPGFVEFVLLKGDEEGAYASHTVWETREAFEAWTKSEAFRKAHAGARMPEGVLRAHPQVRTWTSIL